MSFDLSPLEMPLSRWRGVDRRRDEATAKIDEVLSEPGHAKGERCNTAGTGRWMAVGEDTREPPPLSSP